jgi:hypothetical protein
MNLPKTFQFTSDKLYEKHDYKLVLIDGSSKVFDNYHDVWVFWSQIPPEYLSHVEVLDKKRGFK